MKQKDLVTIIVVVFFGAIFGLIITRFVISVPKNRVTEVEVVNPITAEFNEPDKRYFNDNSIDPTAPIKIGGGGNQQPFDTSN